MSLKNRSSPPPLFDGNWKTPEDSVENSAASKPVYWRRVSGLKFIHRPPEKAWQYQQIYSPGIAIPTLLRRRRKVEEIRFL